MTEEELRAHALLAGEFHPNMFVVPLAYALEALETVQKECEEILDAEARDADR